MADVNLMQWHYVTSAQYAAAGTGDVPAVVTTDLYFISDTKEIKRGSETFSEAVNFYNNASGLPDGTTTPIAANRIYFNTDTLEGKTWNGVSWLDVVKPLGEVVEGNTDKGVSGKAVIDYVTTALQNMSSDAIVTSLSWDKDNKVLTTSMLDGVTTNTTVLDGIGVKLSFNSETDTIQLLDISDNPVGDPIQLDLDRFVKSGEYDAANEDIVLYFNDEKTEFVKIPVGALIDTYTVSSSSTLELAKDDNNNITGSVKISKTEGNTLTANDDGLFVNVPEVDVSGLIPKVDPASAGNIPMLKDDGTIEDSGVAVTDLEKNVVSLYTGTSIAEAVGANTPKHGDVCVVAETIKDNLTQYTAYIYDESIAVPAWSAMDGNYDAENVYFKEDITVTTAIGNITLTNGSGIIPCAGKNMKQTFEAMFTQEKNPTVTQPSVTVTLTEAKAYEVGTNVTPNYTARLNAGSYQYGPPTGITATSWEISDSDNHTSASNAGSFDAFQVTDSTSYRITAKANYGDGAEPKSNLGNLVPSLKIVGGSKSATSSAVSGFRAGFYGHLNTKDGEINSTLVRSLPSKTTAAPAQGNKWTLAIPVGATRLVFAYPATIRDVSSVTDTNGMGAEVKSSFTKHEIQVEGANGYTSQLYKVYVADLAASNDTANTYTITL